MSDELEQTTELDLDKAGEDIMDGVLGEERERPEPVEEAVEEKSPILRANLLRPMPRPRNLQTLHLWQTLRKRFQIALLLALGDQKRRLTGTHCLRRFRRKYRKESKISLTD